MGDDHDLLIRLDEKMDAVLASLKTGGELFKNHEDRLQEEESWTARFKTGIGMIAFIVTVLSAVVVIFVQK